VPTSTSEWPVPTRLVPCVAGGFGVRRLPDFFGLFGACFFLALGVRLDLLDPAARARTRVTTRVIGETAVELVDPFVAVTVVRTREPTSPATIR
jgi:hypothetical protein